MRSYPKSSIVIITGLLLFLVGHALPQGFMGMIWPGASVSAQNAVSYGTRASLPSSGSSNGQQYICTDSPYSFIWNGSSWLAFVFGYQVTEPILSNFTQVNISGNITLDTSHGGIAFLGPSASGTQDIGYIAAAVPGSGAYYVDSAWYGQVTIGNGGFGSGVSAGILTSSKFALESFGAEDGPTLNGWYEKEYNSTTSFNGNNAGSTFFQAGPLVWMRLYDDGTTNRTWYISPNGMDWFQVYQQPRTTNFTPAYGIAAPINYNSQVTAHLVHFSIHT